MKPWHIFAVVLLLAGIGSVAAQDMIILCNGNMIEAKVVEISPSEIRYKRLSQLDGPTIVVPAVDVLTIRYENGTYEIINANAMSAQEGTSAGSPGTTAIDPNKFIFGINANPGGAVGYALGGSGAGINIELGKGKFNSEINLMITRGGFGLLTTFNGFWHSRIGGAYFGGGIGYAFFENESSENYIAHSFTAGLNAGYKFVARSGLYFRIGTFIGFDFGFLWDADRIPVYIKPDLAMGWTVK